MPKIKKTPEWGGVSLSKVQMRIVSALSAGGKIKKIPHDDPKKSSRYGVEHPVSYELIYIANTTIGALKKKGIIDEVANNYSTYKNHTTIHGDARNKWVRS